jgi:hypothetical protein
MVNFKMKLESFSQKQEKYVTVVAMGGMLGFLNVPISFTVNGLAEVFIHS